jgi:hypothetical protein
MNKDQDNTNYVPLDLKRSLMDIATITIPQESIDRVAQRAIRRTSRTDDQRQTSERRIASHRKVVPIIGMACLLVFLFVITREAPISVVAFAQAQQQFENTQTVQFVEYMHEAEAKRRIEQAKNRLEKLDFETEASAMEQNGIAIDREIEKKRFDVAKRKMKIYIDMMVAKLEKGEPIELRRVWIQGRYRHRAEQSEMGSKAIHITNAETGESISLQPDRESCVVLKSHTELNMQSGDKTVTKIGPDPARNFYLQMTQVPADNVRKLGEKKFNGKSAIGFEQRIESEGSVLTKEFWIDSITKLPIRMEAVLRRDGKVVGGATLSEIIFDMPLNPDLFSTTPPDGYSVSEGGSMSLGPAPAKE